MKKILLATTMLAGTAGFAAAEVAVTGYAEIGIWSYNYDAFGDYVGNGTGGADVGTAIAFWQDVEVTFAMSGTTDGGLEFGAKIDLDEGNVALNNDSGTTVYIKGSFGSLTMGDTDGALDWAVQDAGTLTSLSDDHTSHIAYFSANGMDGWGDGQVVRYDNTFGAVGVAVSAEQIGDGQKGGGTILGLGIKYSADLGGTTLNLGLGYQPEDVTDYNVVGLSMGAELAGGFSGMIGFQQYSGPLAGDDADQVGIGLNYTTGALSMNLNYGKWSPQGVPSYDSWGLAVNYDLGGGAVVMAGYGSDMSYNTGNQDQWSIGLGMSF